MAWNLYEQELSRYLPSVGAPWLDDMAWSPVPFAGEDATSTVFIDAAANSFHRDAIPILLPYATDFDAESWWTSQHVLFYRMYCVYGSVIQINSVNRAKKTKNEVRLSLLS